ncbi:MAG: hypothetical protein J7641_13720 [Cyanobacteria bacterium SID2]|nr:hypothetical protein [Cyanobacteria bacterium SID2]MBP0002841.1 hypothetical protein [Cyanobacteria bacterium SBC]
MFLFDRLRQFWRDLTRDESDSAIEAKRQVRLQQAVQGLHNVFQKHHLQPGIDYSIRFGTRGLGLSLNSPRANGLVRSNPEARAALDGVLCCLGDIDGYAGYPCRLPRSPAYVTAWKRASQKR